MPQLPGSWGGPWFRPIFSHFTWQNLGKFIWGPLWPNPESASGNSKMNWSSIWYIFDAVQTKNIPWTTETTAVSSNLRVHFTSLINLSTSYYKPQNEYGEFPYTESKISSLINNVSFRGTSFLKRHKWIIFETVKFVHICVIKFSADSVLFFLWYT